MYEVITITVKGLRYNSIRFDTPWAANMIAIAAVRNYPEVADAMVVNMETGEIEKTYSK